MSNEYLRDRNSLKRIILYIFIGLLPLILAGFYKNGLKLYLLGEITLKGMFKPLFFDVVGFLIGFIVNLIYDLIKKDKINGTMFKSFHPIYGLLIASIISINTNILLFMSVTFICLFVDKLINKSRVNIVALSALIIFIITKLLGDFSYLNIYEKTHTLNLGFLDYLFGRGPGGINTCHILLLFIGFIILLKQKFYKREIPIYSMVIFTGCTLIYTFFTKDINSILNNIFSNGILFSFIFIAPISVASSYTNKGKIVFSILLGLITFGLFLIYPEVCSIASIIIVSLLNSIVDKICEK